MWDHIQMTHPSSLNGNVTDEFSWEVISTFKDPMTRQITEAVVIQTALGKGTLLKGRESEIPIVSLNRKNEYFLQRKRFMTSDNIAD